MSEVWHTKYGPRRVRHDPPTLKEAIFAAQGLTDELQQQAEIAAALMNLPVDEVRAEVLKMAPPRNTAHIVTAGSREGTTRTVIVERRPSRLPAGAKGTRPGAATRPDPGRITVQDRQSTAAPVRLGLRDGKPGR